MVGSSQELAAVLEQVGEGDRAAFEVLYRATSRKLYGIIVGILPSRSLADEILQEVYVKVWQRASDFDGRKSSPITWLAVIARNRALDELRRHARVKSDDIDVADGIAADTPDPLDSRERSDAYRAVIRCLNQLDPVRRDIILLAYYRGLSREALAQRFGHPTATIKTWLHRSLTQLKHCLAA